MSCVHQKHVKFHSIEHHKPRMLKDFLDEKISNSSCSSNDDAIESLPRKPSTSTSMRTLIENDLNSNPNPDSRDSNAGIRSKTKLSKSPLQTILNAVKAVRFFSAGKKSQPAVIFRGSDINNKSTAKMKDIMRWKLCRDPAVAVVVAGEEPCSTAAVNGGSGSSSGWRESDVSSWECGFEDERNDVVADFEFSLFCFSPLCEGDDCVGAATGNAKVGNKKVLICQEEALHSPVSVLQIGLDQFSPPFHQTLSNYQRRDQTLMQHIKKFETLEEYDHDDNDIEEEEEEEEENWVEKRARELLHYVKSTGSMESSKANLDKVLLDIFMEELSARRSNQKTNDGDFELNILRIAKDWIDGSFTHHYDSEHDNRNVYIKDLDLKWGKYKEDQEELALEIENTIFHSLVGEIMGLDC